MTHTAKTIGRRELLGRGASVAALALVASTVPAIATDEDAELKQLWEQWKAQFARCGEAFRIYTDAEERVFDDTTPEWRIESLHMGQARVSFIAYKDGKPIRHLVPIEATNIAGSEKAAKSIQAKYLAEHERTNKLAKRRHKLAAAERADRHESRQLRDIEDRIAETPADGLGGVAIKLALWRLYGSDHHDDANDLAVRSAYKSIVKLTGSDLAAQVAVW